MLLRCMFFLGALTAIQPLAAEPQFIAVAENQELPFEGSGPFEESLQLSPLEAERWLQVYPFVTSLIDDQLLRELSRGSSALMSSYHFVPAAAVPLHVVGASRDEVLYTATLAALPAPPAVQRQLQVYIVGLRDEGQLLPLKVIVTIRGERRE